VKNLIHMSCHQNFFLSCHDINISRIDPQYNPGKASFIIELTNKSLIGNIEKVDSQN
jgi:hypothetical protein